MITAGDTRGVPAVVAPGDGPVSGGIAFRVGYTDETVPQRGITHLIEHLVHYRLGLNGQHGGGSAPTITSFVTQGSPAEVGAFIDQVVDALNDLPFERLQTEKEILHTEAAGRGSASADRLLLWRYGARGHGLGGVDEFGMFRLTPDDLRAWVQTCFSKENAVLWFAGIDAPPQLNLALPRGSHRPPIDPVDVIATPGSFAAGSNLITLHAPVERGATSSALATVWETELLRIMRQEGGWSSQVTAALERVNATDSHLIVGADSHPQRRPEALDGFLHVFGALRHGAFDPALVDRYRRQVSEHISSPGYEVARLPMLATDLLLGKQPTSPDEVLADLESVTADSIRRAADRVAGQAVLMPPGQVPADLVERAGFPPIQLFSTDSVAGTGYQKIGVRGHHLIIGAEGVTTNDGGNRSTVRYSECVALLVYPDGRRDLVGASGICCRIEPKLYAVSRRAMRTIDAAIDPSRVVPMPARDKQAMPKGRVRRDALVFAGGSAAFIGLMFVMQGLDHGWGSITWWPFLLTAVLVAATGIWWYRFR